VRRTQLRTRRATRAESLHLRPPPRRRKPQRPDALADTGSTSFDVPSTAINRFELTARLIERDVLRYSPSGIPMIDCVLHHQSELIEAGQPRQVDLEAPAIAFESVANRLVDCRLDETYRFVGFLANRSRKSKRTIFHIIDFDSTFESSLE
jgi:primosomal replication protein N